MIMDLTVKVLTCCFFVCVIWFLCEMLFDDGLVFLLLRFGIVFIGSVKVLGAGNADGVSFDSQVVLGCVLVIETYLR